MQSLALDKSTASQPSADDELISLQLAARNKARMSTDLPQRRIVAATASPTRLARLAAAGLQVESRPARVDEAMIRESLSAEGASPRDQADTLAEWKARSVAPRFPEDLVLGADQILALDDTVFSKPEDREHARNDLMKLQGRTHRLYSAIVLFDHGQPIWRHIGEARMTMRSLSPVAIDAYLDRNWPTVAGSVGAYQIENEGIRLFSAIEGDHDTILGMPLLPFLNYLTLRGFIPS